MSQRRKKSLMQGTAKGTTVYHHEHRSKKYRQKGMKIRKVLRAFRDEKANKILAKEVREDITEALATIKK